MKTRSIGLVAALALQGLLAQAQRTPKIISPKTPFDKEAAIAMIGKDGTCTIKGVVSKESNYLVNLVILIPYTDYFSEFLELKRKDKKARKR
ncbi:hypothetical protein [Paraflavitalea speifideaquila]|uniref:hypothetical protein n=1 Tax=Paraflavitalea speifideaquila TaxID=3076558 RepID=UPI0028EBFB19|nr:hypothetical protein [Paraflavitalea speifideiaquila]